MPYQLQFDYKLRILLVVYEGNIRGWDISEVGMEITPHFGALRPAAVIVDLAAITSFDVAGDIVRHQAKSDVALVRDTDTPVALVVPRQPHLYGLARMYELSANPPFPRLDIFYSREEALASLKIADPKFEKLVLPLTKD
jgi:hypothetical protein